MSKFVELPPQDYDRNAFDAFASQHGHFDLGDARAMMWMAQLSNETGAPQTIVQIAPLWGFKPIPHFRAQGPVIDTRAIIGERDDCTALAFAGTDPALARNLITDADCRLTASDTHEGFQDAFDAVWPLIEPKIRAARPPLFFTGHSFGAALAVLAAEKAHDLGIAPARRSIPSVCRARADGALPHAMTESSAIAASGSCTAATSFPAFRNGSSTWRRRRACRSNMSGEC
jgi:hypothetical protein